MTYYLFPYEQVNKGERIILRGGGFVGQIYAEQIKKTKYCKMLGIIDKALLGGESDVTHISIDDLDECVFDKIVVAIDPDNELLIKEIYNDLLKRGIPDRKIVIPNSNCKIILDCPTTKIAEKVHSEHLEIVVISKSGLGDALKCLVLIHGINKILIDKCHITFVTKYPSFFADDYYTCITGEEGLRGEFDLLIRDDMFVNILEWAPDKILRISPRLYEFCISTINLNKELKVSRNILNYIMYTKLVSGNWIVSTDPEQILGINLENLPELSWRCNGGDVLEKYGLANSKYIVVNRDVDIAQTDKHPKLWPIEYYNILLGKIKQNYPNVKIVRIGARDCMGEIAGVDIDLTGKTTLDEIKPILKNAMFLISGEGGLVHVNHLLKGRSVVLFGPTDEEFFGYKEDVICVNREKCKIPCNYILDDWLKGCMRDEKEYQCMHNLMPEDVYEKIKDANLLW